MPETNEDPSASTASFRAFAQRTDDDVRAGRHASSSRTMLIIVAAAVAVLVVAGILAAAL